MLPAFLLVFYFLNYDNVTRSVSLIFSCSGTLWQPYFRPSLWCENCPSEFSLPSSCWRSCARLLWVRSCGAHVWLSPHFLLSENSVLINNLCWWPVPLWKTCKALLDSLSLYTLTHEYPSWSFWETRQHNGNDEKNHLPSPHLNPRILMTSFPFQHYFFESKVRK